MFAGRSSLPLAHYGVLPPNEISAIPVKIALGKTSVPESGVPFDARTLELSAIVIPPPGLEHVIPSSQSLLLKPWKPTCHNQTNQGNQGSLGHPHFCSRPCVHIVKGAVCPSGDTCTYCHFPHRPITKPDKHVRLLLAGASEQQLLSTFLPFIRRKAQQEKLLPQVGHLIELLEREVQGPGSQPLTLRPFKPMRMSFMHLVETSMRDLPPQIRTEVDRLKAELPPSLAS